MPEVKAEEVFYHVCNGIWSLEVEIRKPGMAMTEVHEGVVFRLSSLLQYDGSHRDGIDRTIERDALEARLRQSGQFLFRISLDDYRPNGSGFRAEGIGYADPTDPKARRRAKIGGDPYYGGSPAVQFWRAVRQ